MRFLYKFKISVTVERSVVDFSPMKHEDSDRLFFNSNLVTYPSGEIEGKLLGQPRCSPWRVRCYCTWGAQCCMNETGIYRTKGETNRVSEEPCMAAGDFCVGWREGGRSLNP